MKDIGWGIIGCGAVTERKSGPAFQKVRGSRLAAVMRRTSALAEDYARRHGVPAWYDDAAALVRDPRVDAVYIATPPGSHLEYALLACAAKKPTYVEKPMARNHDECVKMVDAFRAADIPLFVAYYRRALPRFLKAREIVRGGRLGAITGVTYRFAGHYHHEVDRPALPWRLRAEESGGGLVLDLGCHTLDILDFLVGPLTSVSGAASNVASPYDVEDTVAMQFRTESGALGVAHWNFASAVRADEIAIQGDKGELRLSTFGDEPVVFRDASATESFDLRNPTHIQEPMIASVVAELLGEGRCESTGSSGTRTSAVIDAALVGYYGRRDSGFWRDPAGWPGRRPRRETESTRTTLT